MKRFEQQIEHEKLRFLRALQSFFPELNIKEISAASTQIEDLIANQLVTSFLSNIQRIFGTDEIRVVANGFHFSKTHFQLLCQGSLNKPEELIFACIGRGTDLQTIDTVEIGIDLKERGKYSMVQFLFPIEANDIDEDFLNALTNSLFSVAYKWLSDSITRAIAQAASRINQEMYQFVRVMSPDEQLLEGFWFSVLVLDKAKKKPQDIVLLDDFAAKMSLIPATKAAQKLGRNPVNIVTDFVTEIVDYEESVFCSIQDVGKVIELDLQAGTAYQSSSQFNLTLRGVWGNKVCCFPLHKSDELSLICFFKIGCREVLEPFLQLHRKHLAKIALDNIKYISDGLEIIKKIKAESGTSFAKWGEFVGGIAGQFAKTITDQ